MPTPKYLIMSCYGDVPKLTDEFQVASAYVVAEECYVINTESMLVTSDPDMLIWNPIEVMP